MRKPKQIVILVGILAGVFLLGFLAGVSSARPLKQVIPARSPADDPQPEEFVQNFASRMTQHLNLTPEQQPLVEEHIRTMSERIRNAQRNFIPQIDKALLETIDQILPLLTEEQQTVLKRQRDGIANSKRVNRVGQPFNRGGPRPGFGPPPGAPRRGPGQRPWGDGPPPWVRNGSEPPAPQ